MLKIKLYIFIVALLSFKSVFAGEDQPSIAQVLESEANELLKDPRFSSVSVGVVKQQFVFSKHFGELTKQQNNKPTDRTIYEIGSVSKVMLGLLVANAVQEGKFALNDNINQYFNGALTKVSGENNPITIQQLLTHTSGLPRGYEELGLKKDTVSRSTFITAIDEWDTSKFKGKYHYSSAGSELLSHLLEKRYRVSFDKLLVRTLQSQAGMSNTQVNLSAAQMPYFAYGYNQHQKVAIAHTQTNPLWGGSGYIKSTMADLLKFMRLQLDPSNKAVTASQQPLFKVTKHDALGYFWIVSEDEQLGQYLIHHGGLESAQNWLLIVPEHQLAVSVVSNSSFPETASILRRMTLTIAKAGLNTL